jgi:hypothetical protein
VWTAVPDTTFTITKVAFPVPCRNSQALPDKSGDYTRKAGKWGVRGHAADSSGRACIRAVPNEKAPA